MTPAPDCAAGVDTLDGVDLDLDALQYEPLADRPSKVHLAHLGRPILGDPRYGGALALGGAAVPRLMLHAAALSFPHPDGVVRRIEAPWPADLVRVAAVGGIEVEASTHAYCDAGPSG